MKTKEKYQLYKPKKFFGQNFLVDDNISKKIIKQLDLTDDDFVLEIGPGQGALTKHLTDLKEKYAAVEIDTGIVYELKNKFGDINVINKDFLKFDFDLFKERIKIIGNLPYNIASEILFRLFDNRDKIKCAVVMVQKEFAQRLTAKPNSKEYGILSVQTQYFSEPSLLFNVPPTVFFPKPKVESSVVKLDFNKKNKDIDVRTFKELVRASFGKRRKIIRNSLKDYFEKKNLDYEMFEFDFSRRAENINVAEYVELTEQIKKITANA